MTWGFPPDTPPEPTEGDFFVSVGESVWVFTGKEWLKVSENQGEDE